MADTQSDLTPKQARVYEMLQEGLNVKEIAARMKVTPSAVSLHLRKMHDRGVELPGIRFRPRRKVRDRGEPKRSPSVQPPSGQAEQPPVSTAQPAATNHGAADGDLDAMVRNALEARLGDIDREREELAAQEEKYRTALAALA